MATMGVFFEDDSFRRPRWAIFDMNANACELPVGKEAEGAPATVPGYPLFDVAKDGPILPGSSVVRLETTSGNLDLRIDPTVAPANATQLSRLFAAGAYDGVELFRYERNFVLQCSNADSKAQGYAPISSEALALLRRLPLEVQAQKDGHVKHTRGVVSMAREDGNADTAVSSFSILLGDAPHLDGSYTIVGRVLEDAQNVAAVERMERDWLAGHRPVIVRTRLLDAPTK